MPYYSDRQFTDKVHDNLAVQDIYPEMGWNPQQLNARLAENTDQQNAVDYFAIEDGARIVTIQERFREYKYHSYSDFTVRYMRPHNSHSDRVLSEFFKLDADYFLYGIINTSKTRVDEATHFVKVAVLDLGELKELIDNGTIIIDPSLPGYTCRRDGNIMRCPVNENYDHSSNFVPFDIRILSQIAPQVIVYQDGFC